MRRISLHGLLGAFCRVSLSTAVWVAFLVGTMVHVYLRGEADGVTGNVYSPASLEQALFHGVPSVWLQEWLSTDAVLVKWTAVVLHASWFYVPLALAVLVQLRGGPGLLAQLLGLHLVLLLASDALYALAPTSPPWMEYDLVRVVDVAWGDTSSVDANQVAALPSLHVAVPALYTIWFACRPERALKRLWPLLSLWTLGVAWSVVYGGEHYFVDAIAGVLWAGCVYGLTWAASRAVIVLSSPIRPRAAGPRPLSRRYRPLI
jgi:hypothetical protein